MTGFGIQRHAEKEIASLPSLRISSRKEFMSVGMYFAIFSFELNHLSRKNY